MPASERFIVHMLDPTHMSVHPHVAEMIKSTIAEFRGQNNYEKPHLRIILPSISRVTLSSDIELCCKMDGCHVSPTVQIKLCCSRTDGCHVS
jgi:TFIIH basal transcription factor complex TTD-A subunit